MKNWIRKAGILTAGAGLLAASVCTAPLAFAQTRASAVSHTRITALSQTAGQATPWNPPVLQSGSQKGTLNENELVINYSKPLSSAQHRMAGGTVIKQFGDLHYAVVKIGLKQKLTYVIDNYRKFSNVVSVTPSAIYQPLGLADPKELDQYQNEMLHLNEAQLLAGKNRVTVAVIDQGVDMNHPDLKGRLLPGYNAVSPMNQGAPDFHGTHVAGIIAADKGNGIGGFGVNPNAEILPIDVFDRTEGASDYSIAQGILYAIQKGAKIINMSLGSPMPSPLVEEAIKKALDNNITVVAAAGNTGDSTPNYPAAYEGVISVGSVNQEKKLSDFSTFGPSVDVVAPGEGIYSTTYEYERKSSFRRMSGTSMAAPMVAGAASLLLSKNPKLTPYQIEYILEHTAEDLGDKGYDVKYGYGLINPLKALRFDLKRIPPLARSSWTEKEQLAAAEKVSLDGPGAFSGAITQPYAEKWYKADVKKGDTIQFVLDGAAKFDYKLMLQLLSPDKNVQLDVNKVREGKKEGKLFEAPFSGTLLFGVKDVNGRYDDSGNAESKFTVTAQKMSAAPEDESTIIKPIQLDFPYQNPDAHFTLADANGDDDYYRFSVKEKQAVKINLSDLPGVDTSLSVYTEDQFFPPDMDKMTPEEKQKVLDGLTSGSKEIVPTFYANKGGYSEGERLTFIAQPDTPYIVKVSNKVDNQSGVIDYYQNISQMTNNQQPEAALLPYQLEITGKVFPADEDTLPVADTGDGGKIATPVPASVNAQDPSQKIINQNDYIQSIKDGARTFEIGGQGKGFLQTPDDEDWFAVTPKTAGIYSFDFSDQGASVPVMEVYKIANDKDNQGKPLSNLAQIGTNVQYNSSSSTLSPHFYTGLDAGETYYLKIRADYMSGNLSFDPYRFSSKMFVQSPQDPFAVKDTVENVKNLPSSDVTGFFSMPNAQDAYYYQAKVDQVIGISLERKAMDRSWMDMFPKEIMNPFYGTLAVVEDANNNHKIDDDEYDRLQYIDLGAQAGMTYGSFKAEKNKNYIFLLTGIVDGPVPLTLWPYEFKVTGFTQRDEDSGSVVKNNIPSKPIALKASEDGEMFASGYLNAGIPYGDEDWYSFTLKKEMKGSIELDTGMEVDGLIDLYKNGKLLAQADYYPEGDSEVLFFDLKPGTYHIKVRDTNGNATLNPYTLTVDYQ